MPKFLTAAKNRRLAANIAYQSRRIAELTETIEGIEEDMWPDEHASFCELRRQAAFRRSDLIKKQQGV
jgi:hypothetical protein